MRKILLRIEVPTLVTLAALWFGGCDGQTGDPGTVSNTDFWSGCAVDADCDDGLGCACGRCTIRCDGEADCAERFGARCGTPDPDCALGDNICLPLVDGPVSGSRDGADASVTEPASPVDPPPKAIGGSGGVGNAPGTGGVPDTAVGGSDFGLGGASGATGGAAAGSASRGGTAGAASCDLASTQLSLLTLDEIADSIVGLLGPEVVGALQAGECQMAPNASPMGTSDVYDAAFVAELDAMVERAARHVVEDLTRVSECSPQPDDPCAQQFIRDLAERAFGERASGVSLDGIAQVYDEVRAFGGDTTQALEYSVQAILLSPLFSYRFEHESNGDCVAEQNE